MKLKVFTLRLDPTAGTFDDAALTEFLAEREALSVFEHFFFHDQAPTWALLISYRDGARDGGGDRGRRSPRDWWAELADDERPAFEALRRWRSERAKRDGRPPYLLLTNQQMFRMARSRPTTLAALTEIKGIGAGKAGDFGEEVLALLAETLAEPDGAAAQPASSQPPADKADPGAQPSAGENGDGE